jgi:tRNA A37 threonylcarbamoyladenosine modification protein TsaB
MITLIVHPIEAEILLIIQENGIIKNSRIIPKGDDFSTFPETIRDIVEEFHIDEIWCISGPGPFTRMRIITLTLNTVHLVTGIGLKEAHYFELIPKAHRLMRINATQYLVQREDGEISLVEKEDIPPGSYIGSDKENDFTNDRHFIQYILSITDAKRVFETKPFVEKTSPIYYKDPHITWSKKNIFPS